MIRVNKRRRINHFYGFIDLLAALSTAGVSRNASSLTLTSTQSTIRACLSCDLSCFVKRACSTISLVSTGRLSSFVSITLKRSAKSRFSWIVRLEIHAQICLAHAVAAATSASFTLIVVK
jgi:hypothetical protein